MLIASLLGAGALRAGATSQPQPGFEWGGPVGAGEAVAIDGSGDVIVAGEIYYWGGDSDPGPGVLPVTAVNGVLHVSKSDPDGNLVWSRVVGDASFGIAGVDTDGAGNIYVAGWFYGLVDFDPGPGVLERWSAEPGDVYVLKLSPDGDLEWVRTIGHYINARALVVEANGDVVLAGDFDGTNDFDPGVGAFSMTATSVEGDAFGLKLDSAGDFVWAKQFTSAGGVAVSAVALDPQGRPLIGGKFVGAADFDPGSGVVGATGLGGGDGFLLKLTAAGDFFSVRLLQGSGTAHVTGIAADGDGTLVLAGGFHGEIDFAPGQVLAMRDGQDGAAFVLKLDAAGYRVWDRQVPDASGAHLALGHDGGVYAAGRFEGNVDFDPGSGSHSLSSGNGGAAYVLKLATDGSFAWAFPLDGAETGPFVYAMAVDEHRNLAITGWNVDATDLDPGVGTVIADGDDQSDPHGFFAFYSQNTAPLAPLDLDPAANGVSEIATVGDLTGIDAYSFDADGDAIEFSLSDDAGGRFGIDPVTGQVFVADPALLDGPATHSITAVASDFGKSSSQPFTVSVMSDAPVVSATATVASATYSDPPTPVMITAVDTPADVLAVVGTFPDDGTMQSGLTLALGSNGPGVSTYTLGGLADVAPGKYWVTVAVSDDDGESAYPVAVKLTVSPDEATVAFDPANPLVVPAEGAASGQFDLGVVLGTGSDPSPGNIEFATLGVELVPMTPHEPIPGSCVTAGGGQWTCSFEGVPLGAYTVEAVVGGYFSGAAQSMLIVAGEAGSSSADGEGTYVVGAEPVDFAFSASGTTKGAFGELALVRSGDDGDHELVALALDSVAAGENLGSAWTVFTADADYLAPGMLEPVACEVIVYAVDAQAGDRVWVRTTCGGTPLDVFTMPSPAAANTAPLQQGFVSVNL